MYFQSATSWARLKSSHDYSSESGALKTERSGTEARNTGKRQGALLFDCKLLRNKDLRWSCGASLARVTGDYMEVSGILLKCFRGRIGRLAAEGRAQASAALTLYKRFLTD